MGKILDLTGQKFGRLTVLGLCEQDKNKPGTRWLCQCSCGNTSKVLAGNLRKESGTKSCGCLAIERSTKHGKNKKGVSRRGAYYSYCGMKQRCLNIKHHKYKNYGGRGIAVCDHWKESFANFYKDMGDPPTSSHSIDRIDNNGDYSKDNCKWSTPKEQRANQRAVTHRKIYAKRSDNTSGPPGVVWAKKSSTFEVSYKGKYIGRAKNFFDACCIRKSAELKMV